MTGTGTTGTGSKKTMSRIKSIGFNNSVQVMRKHGMDDTMIACVVCDLRSWAITEERLRVRDVMDSNPPQFPTHIEMKEELENNVD